jgi:hypothetical protein
VNKPATKLILGISLCCSFLFAGSAHAAIGDDAKKDTTALKTLSANFQDYGSIQSQGTKLALSQQVSSAERKELVAFANAYKVTYTASALSKDPDSAGNAADRALLTAIATAIDSSETTAKTSTQIKTDQKHCDLSSEGSELRKAFSPTTIFPLVPKEILSEDLAGCSPPYWTREVMIIFAYKVLGLLNWAAATTAVFSTIYAGILYLTGFYKEDNAKKARAILTATLTGFIIVLSARLILGSSQLITGDTSGQLPTDETLIPAAKL